MPDKVEGRLPVNRKGKEGPNNGMGRKCRLTEKGNVTSKGRQSIG